jgi:peptidyl-dipeptidase Dcp
MVVAGALTAEPSKEASAEKPAVPATQDMNNPFLTESTLPFQFPRFDLIREEHYLPAFAQGMAEQLREVAAIAESSEEPTFENTIVALERSGQLLGRVGRVFGSLNSTLSTPGLQAIEKEMAPKLSAHSDAIRLNPKLFRRVEALYGRRATLGLDPESAYLLEKYYKDFIRSGAKLDEAKQVRMRAINKELATLQTTFSQNVLKEAKADSVLVDTREELAGLSEAEIATAAADAKKAGSEGKYLISLVNTTGQAPLAQLTNRALRERLYKASIARGSHGGEFDNRAVVSSIARLRAERAQLLGFETYAAFSLSDQTAGSVDTVNKLMVKLAAPAVANARREGADIQDIMNVDNPGAKLEPWDWAFYTEKVRTARYAFDDAAVRPYFEANRVMEDGVFYAANKLYGISFKERKDLPKYHPDTRTFEVIDADGSTLAFLIMDWYARPGQKKGGAWANSYVSQSTLLGTHPVVANHLNLTKPVEGQPTLLSLDELRTAFHEFGHNLHAMFSNVKYPRFSGTSVPRDFVEFPSQVNEMWKDWPEVLAHYARHYQTGAPLPEELLAKVKAAARFNQGFMTTEYLAATVLDQAWHQLTPEQVPGPEGVLEFEAAALHKAGLDYAAVMPRYRSTYFSHTFAGGYAAGYYSYIWAEVLDADTVEWMKSHGGLLRANGDRFRAQLLSRGGSGDVMGFFRTFKGADPDIQPLLVRRGLNAAQ